MIRFALVAASALGFCLMAALCNMILPLRRVITPQPGPAQSPATTPDTEAGKTPEAPEAPEVPAPPPVLCGLGLMVSVLAAAGVGWTAACVADIGLPGSQLTTRLLIALGGALMFGGIGAADDAIKTRLRAPLGLRRGARFLLEAGAAAVTLALLYAGGWLTTGFTLPFTGYVELGAAAPAVWGLGLIALAECARTASGASGAECGALFVGTLGLMYALTILGWFALAVLPAALAGALMAFLIWGFPPAKLSCGAAGGMFAAGALACLPLCVGWPELALPLCLPLWLEGGMVALQIISSRLTRGRALFSAAPLHRWLEKRGVSAIATFYIMCALAAAGALGCVYVAGG